MSLSTQSAITITIVLAASAHLSQSGVLSQSQLHHIMSGSDRNNINDDPSKSIEIIMRTKQSKEHLNTENDSRCTTTQVRRKKNYSYNNDSVISYNSQLTSIPFVFANDSSVPVSLTSCQPVSIPPTSTDIPHIIPSPPFSQLPSILPPKLPLKKEKFPRKSTVTSSYALVDQNGVANESTLDGEKRPKKYNKKVPLY